MTIEGLEKVPFHLVSYISGEDEHTTTYFSKDGKMGFRDHLPFKNGEPHGRPYRHYWLNGKVYKSKKKFLEAIKNDS